MFPKTSNSGGLRPSGAATSWRARASERHKASRSDDRRQECVEALEARRLLSTTWSTDLEYGYVNGAGANGLATDAQGTVYVAAAGAGADGTVHGLVMKRDPVGTWSAEPVLDYQLAPGQAARFNAVGVDATGSTYAVGQATDVDGVLSWVVCKSADGGSSWDVVDRYRYVPGQNAAATGFAADASGSIYVIGYGKDATYKRNNPSYIEHWLVRKSTDGGATWSVVDDYRAAPDYYSSAQDITVSGGNLYVVGKSRDYWITRRSTNGGATWATIDQYQLDTQWNSQANGVAADDQGNVYVVGEGMKGAKMSRTAHWVVRKLPAGGSGWATVDRWQLSPNVGWTYGSIAEDVVAGPGGEVHVVGRGWANTSGTSSHYLTRSSTDGGVTWMTTDDHKPDAAANSSGWAIARDRDGNLLTAGTVGYSSGGSHLAVRTTAAATPIAVFATARISDPLLDDSLAADEIFA